MSCCKGYSAGASNIAGKWLKVYESGIAEYMAVLGSPAPPEAKLILEWVDKGDNTIEEVLTINDVEHRWQFKLGEEVEHESFDGTLAKSTFTMPNANTLIEIQIHNDKETKVERRFVGESMSTTFTVTGSDVIAVNEFELVQE